MRTRVSGLVALMAGLALCLPAQAHARFGKSGGGGGSRGGGRATVHTSGGSTRISSPSGGYRSSGRSSGGYRSGWSSYGPGVARPVRVSPSFWAAPRVSPMWGPPRYQVWGYGFAVAPTVVVDGAPPPPSDGGEEFAEEPLPEQPPALVTAIAGDVTPADHGTMLGAQLSFEGSRFGFIGAYNGVLTPSSEVDEFGARQIDVLHLAQARLTYALVSGYRGRLRAEFGAHLAVAPDVTFVAPGVGLSGVLGLAGPFGIEGRVFGNAWPYSQIDARAGLTVASARFGVSVGYRVLYLNDHGVLGNANAGATSDFYRGPYISLAFAL
jgi:hypothetical protein